MNGLGPVGYYSRARGWDAVRAYRSQMKKKAAETGPAIAQAPQAIAEGYAATDKTSKVDISNFSSTGVRYSDVQSLKALHQKQREFVAAAADIYHAEESSRLAASYATAYGANCGPVLVYGPDINENYVPSATDISCSLDDVFSLEMQRINVSFRTTTLDGMKYLDSLTERLRNNSLFNGEIIEAFKNFFKSFDYEEGFSSILLKITEAWCKCGLHADEFCKAMDDILDELGRLGLDEELMDAIKEIIDLFKKMSICLDMVRKVTEAVKPQEGVSLDNISMESTGIKISFGEWTIECTPEELNRLNELFGSEGLKGFFDCLSNTSSEELLNSPIVECSPDELYNMLQGSLSLTA